jgi:hypothetical protein
MNKRDIHVGLWYEVPLEDNTTFEFEVLEHLEHGIIRGIIHNPTPQAVRNGWFEGDQVECVMASELRCLVRRATIECIDEPPGPPGPF